MKSIFEGTGVAIVTPFKNNEVDYSAFEKLIENDLSCGVKAFIILGTTGEGSTISQIERKKIIKFCKEKIADKAKVVVGTGNNNFETCMQNTAMAKELEADGVLVVTPYYNKTTQLGLVKYYKELSKIEIPMIMYNVPSRTGLNLELQTIELIMKTNEWIYGIKESTSDASRICKLCHICKDKIAVYSGEDNLNFMFYALGASGCISVTANVFGDSVQKVFDLCQKNNFKQALELQQKLAPIDAALFLETNPTPVKYMLSQKGLCQPEVRLPLVEMSEGNKTLLNSNLTVFENNSNIKSTRGK